MARRRLPSRGPVGDVVGLLALQAALDFCHSTPLPGEAAEPEEVDTLADGEEPATDPKMPKEPAYDLIVLLDAEAPEERRSQLIQQVQSQIEAGAGTLKGDADWGVRKLAFEIGHRTEAHYHLFQLEAKPELLGQLRHMLAIEDGVIRHRIIRLTKGAPEKAPTLAPQARQPEPVRDDPSEQEPAPEPAVEQALEPAVEQASEPAAEQVAEQAPEQAPAD